MRNLQPAAVWVLLLLSFLSAPPANAAAPIAFNRDIRPILSENCFLCHGPDKKERKGGLRLDSREDALKPARSGKPAIVPGDPAASELLARVTHSDPDDRMPPSGNGKPLTAGQIETLRLWIEQGAPYAEHWSYTKPVRPELSEVKDAAWPRNALDYFILARLEREGLTPSPEAGRRALARRVALDLTGLPPSPAEVEAFLKDQSSAAYERYVDRLLASPAFGEHWARMWLDLARYADSDGYADDPLRTIWAFRDYVIQSFNANKPFDQFTIEQIAGDLLPEPTEEQLIATAFHRNTMTNNEGGTSDEEFRNAAVVDRVNTTMAVWMGTSMACAQCHTHKYDPITQEEYFQFMAFLNNTADADRPDEAPLLEFFTRSQKEKRAGLRAEISELEVILAKATPELENEFQAWRGGFPTDLEWHAPKPASVEYDRQPVIKTENDGRIRVAPDNARETYTIELPLQAGPLSALRLEAIPDDTLPGKGAGHGPDGAFAVSQISATMVPPGADSTAGRFIRVELPGKGKILSLAEVQVFSGGKNAALEGKATQSSADYGAEAQRAIDGNTSGVFNDGSTTHTKTSDDPWWELDLGQARPVSRIVIWNRTDGDLHTRLKDFRVQLLSEDRSVLWEKQVADAPNPSAELPVDGSRPVQFAAAFAPTLSEGSDPLSVISGKLDPKKAWYVAGGAEPQSLTLIAREAVQVPEGSRLIVRVEHHSERPHHSLGSFRLAVAGDERLIPYNQTSPRMLALLSAGADSQAETELLRQYYLRWLAPALSEERARVAALQKQIEAIKPNTVPIMRELAGDKRRETHIQYRGSFMDLGPVVQPAVPDAFHPFPEDAPRNRLGLAQWLVHEDNPLTGRVMANRFWEQIFGTGLVSTSEEFGSQGELPSHPALLDWLAVEFSSGWDMKGFLKLLVTSATYRQSSRVTPELLEADPDNRLLARGARFRMTAEMIRDQALAIAGLLSPKMHGPSVRPLRPASGLKAAFGGSVDWKTSPGQDRFRRGLYTEWRRTSPYPSMATFDAPNREVCTIRRTRTNTPLQALVTLNDPVYWEAAQGLARRMNRSGSDPAEKIRRGFLICLARPPSDPELDRLAQLFETASARFAADPEAALLAATDPIGALPEGAAAVELAALTTVANVLLNLDETLMKR